MVISNYFNAFYSQVRKREKLKLLLIKTTEECVMDSLNPLGAAMHKILDQLVSKDNLEIFLDPVDVNEVPDYANVIKNPIDLGTMRAKLRGGVYESIDELESDFSLMIRNCLLYNNKETIFYKVGVKVKEQGGAIFRQVRRELEKSGMIEAPIADGELVKIIDNDMKEILDEEISIESLKRLELLLAKAGTLKHHLSKAKKIKTIKNEISKMKRSLMSDESEGETKSSVSEISHVEKPQEIKTPPTSPLKASSLSTPSPSNPGVNRR